MSKSITTFWNTLPSENVSKWESITNTGDQVEGLTLAINEETGNYAPSTRFKAGANNTAFGEKLHDYPEEVYIISGKLYDEAFDMWLEDGFFASRPAGEKHGSFYL